MSYQVLARKWRPRTFEEVVGQQHIVQALQNALSLGRLHHAYLFSGTRGVGKTTLARILAKCFNCEKGVGANPCNQCAACEQTDAGRYVDMIEVDAASRTGVENMRELLDNVPYAPNVGTYKIYLIDEVHMLSISSFNALLKTLEEPPEHIKFFFATTHPQKIPVTILSRCLQFNLLRLPYTSIRDYIAKMLNEENIDFEENALNEIAVAADGSVRDALSLLDQAISYGNGTLKDEEVRTMLGTASRSQVVALLKHIADQDVSSVIDMSGEIYQTGVDFNDVIRELIALLHQVALRQALPKAELSPQFEEAEVAALAAKLKPEDTQLYYQFALAAKRDLAVAADYKAAFEMTLLKMVCFVPLNTESISLPAQRQTQATANTSPSQINTHTTSTDALKPANPTDTTGKESYQEKSVQTSDKSLSTHNTPRQQKNLMDCNSVDDWQQYIEASGLGGAARGICLNSSLTIQSDNQAIIEVPPDIEGICTEELKAEIINTLKQLNGSDVQLTFKYAIPDTTPVSEGERINQQKQHDAEQSIKGDPVVQALQEKLGAQFVSNATKPIESKEG